MSPRLSPEGAPRRLLHALGSMEVRVNLAVLADRLSVLWVRVAQRLKYNIPAAIETFSL